MTIDNTDLGIAVLLPYILLGFAQSIPSLLIGAGAVICISKGYVTSGILLLCSPALALLSNAALFVIQRMQFSNLPFRYQTIAYFSQFTHFVTGILLAAGILVLTISLGKNKKAV